ncbi:MAG: CHRD domain-containing protein [Deltaproteobacteria bacterium]|nr:CHRD domain-containing protein [Deltaproteobacteria bacterium]
MQTKSRAIIIAVLVGCFSLLLSANFAAADDPDFSGGVLTMPRLTINKITAVDNVKMGLDLTKSTFSLLGLDPDIVTTTKVTLSGGQEVPPNSTPGAGRGVFMVNTVTGAISGTVIIASLPNVTAAHIHTGPVGVSGPVIIPLIGDGEVRVVPQHTVLTADQLGLFLQTGLYVNVHTTELPNGAIRGQLDPSPVERSVTPLSGAETVPPVTSTGSALGVLKVDFKTRAISGKLTITGLTNVTAAHIHDGAVGVNGPIIVPLQGDGQTMTIPAGSVLTDSQFTSFMNGGLYLNVHTTAFPNGEIRGQIYPAVR